MAKYPTVAAGRTVLRFLLGSETPTLASAPRLTLHTALKLESNAHGDVLVLDALDGARLDNACSCTEKTVAWVRHALRTWPRAGFVGKTEDDTFLHLDMLALELERLAAWRLPNVVYGLFGICAMPRPARAERSATGFKACFLGSLERVGWMTGAYRSLVQWRQALGTRGSSKSKNTDAAAPR